MEDLIVSAAIFQRRRVEIPSRIFMVTRSRGNSRFVPSRGQSLRLNFTNDEVVEERKSSDREFEKKKLVLRLATDGKTVGSKVEDN